MDIYSRYVVGWMVADRENSALAGRLIQQSCLKHGVQPRVLTLHSDRGAPMTSQCTAQLLADLGRSSRTLRQRCAEAQTAPGGRLHQSSHPFPHHTGHCSLINPVECPIVVDRFRLPPILRALEGCARVVIGEVEGANIIKLDRQRPKISYLSYPDFDVLAHPALAFSVVIWLDTMVAKFYDFSRRANPPILHRKETLVPVGYPN